MTIAPGQDEYAGATCLDIMRKTKMSRNAIKWIADELEAIRVIRRDPEGETELVYTLTPEFEPIWVRALGLQESSHPTTTI